MWVLRELLAVSAAVVCVLAAPKLSVDPKIIGGENAAVGEFPWQVSLRSASNSHFCGGSILNEFAILTAAHCVVGRTPSTTFVVSGTTKLSSGGNNHPVSSIIVHENYNPSDSWRNDVAIIKLAHPITMSAVEKPTTLPAQGQNPGENDEATISGWGYTKAPSSPLPDNLQKLKQSIVPNTRCVSEMSIPVYSTQICAGIVSGQGVCNGDSGGPLYSGGKQVGIVSWGARPCAKGVPDVNTRVASYVDWILKNSA